MKEVIVAHPLPAFATVARLKRHAKQLLKKYRENPSLSEELIARHCPDDLGLDFKLADAQRVIAREYGFDSWTKLKRYLESRPQEQLIFDAVAAEDADAVESLLAENNKLIDARSGWQLYRPLFFAMQKEHAATVEILRRRGAKLDIFEAAALGDVAELRRLLAESSALAKARREHCDATPLHAARSNVAAAQLLIEFGADVNAIDGEKQRLMPLHGRAEHGDVEVVDLLLAHGADVHAASCMGTPLHCAVGGFQHEPPVRWREVAARLLEFGANVNAGSPATGDPTWTPLHHAAWRNHIAAVSWLLEHGADRTRINKYGSTPLETARYFHHKEVATLLSAE
jgi:ankyrin repeat protein